MLISWWCKSRDDTDVTNEALASTGTLIGYATTIIFRPELWSGGLPLFMINHRPSYNHQR